MSVGIFFLLILASLTLVPTAYGLIRDDIDALQSDIKKLYESIRTLEVDIQKTKNDISTYEVSVRNAETRIDVAKYNYDNAPSDDTRKIWQDATNDLAKARNNLNNAEAKLESLENSLRDKNNQVITKEKEIAELVLLPDYSQTKKSGNEHIGIVLSQSCLTMVKNNMTTNCPTYEQLEALFPDTSNQVISGELRYIDGMYQRSTDAKNGHWGFYRFDETGRTWIDPPGNIRDKIDLIIIEPRLPEYKLPGLQKVVDYQILTGHNRHVDNCRTATITAEDWMFLIGDTMRYMKNDCNPNYTNFDHIKKTTLAHTFMDISTSYKWKLDNWIAQAKQDCKTLCKEY